MLQIRSSSARLFIRATTPAILLAFNGLALAIDTTGVADPAAARRDLQATFIEHDDGAAAKNPAAPAAPAPPVARWDRPKADVPARLREAAFPSYYIAGGQAIELHVDVTRIVVKSDLLTQPNGAAALAREIADAGIAVAKIAPVGSRPWALVELAHPMTDAAGINAVAEMILGKAVIAFAGPVFHNPEVAGGFYTPTDRINLRVREAAVNDTDAVITRAAPDLAITPGAYGDLLGARQLQSSSRNGFDVLRQINALAQHPDLAWATASAIQTGEAFAEPNDPNWPQMWGWKQNSDIDIDAEFAWDLIKGRSSIKILVMDTGIDQTHPDINQDTGRDFSEGDVNGIGNGNPDTLCDNHGTGVAGIITGRIDNTLGGAGVCPSCRVIAAKVADGLTTAPCGNAWIMTNDNFVNALEWGENQGARITNSSFGIAVNDDVTDAYNDKWLNGAIHFAAAGNGGDDSIGDPTISYPARLSPEVQAVANLQPNGTLNPSSNFGTGLDFAAPGSSVASTDRQGAAGYGNGDYVFFGGTSAASPFAAGIAGLIWSAYPDWSAGQVVAAMRLSATDLGTPGYDTTYGDGLPNAYVALTSSFPYNGWCQTATPIDSWNFNPVPYGTVQASSSPDEPQEFCEVGNVGVGHTVWYRFTPPCSGFIDVNTNGSSYDTVMSVWLNGCNDTLLAACDDDSGAGNNSQITQLPAIEGVPYYFKVGSYGNSNGGLLDFNFLYTPLAPHNDECDDAQNISTHDWTTSVCTYSATVSPCDGADTCATGGAAGGATSHSVWYQFTPPVNGKGNAETNGSDYDTVMSVWNGCRVNFAPGICFPPDQLLCDNNSGPGTSAQFIGMPMKKGVTYRIKVSENGAAAANIGGRLNFHFIFQPCPADFNLSGAVTVQDLFDFLGAFFAGDRESDFNEQGGITVQDLFDYLAAFFSSPC